MSIDNELSRLGIELPQAPKPLGSYVPCVQVGNLLFLSGQLPLWEGRLLSEGRVDLEVSVETAREAARQTVINALSVIRGYLGSLDTLKRCIRLTGYVSSAPGFFRQPDVLNAASDLLYELMGERGRHTRVAVGVEVLPLNSPIEIEFIFEVGA
ncbi:RidA family protein [Candidatus Magnetobacterium casense]|uniref:RidA family protein n=1 Tax=Candidatus Magnetobacterium casense TaxID=1455061 RepID=A0ABS6RWD3_9BACT|nr:RidA family protein [Candidatus Magnetobacterium casensis]MBV6340933.1 RidA family protein [Candidatus Magnetobacterium casensis]